MMDAEAQQAYKNNALFLFSQRDAQGNPLSDGQHRLPAEQAAKLLAAFDMPNQGQGGFSLILSPGKLADFGLSSDVWESASVKGAIKKFEGRGYEIDYVFATHGVLPLLEKWAGCSLSQAQETAEKFRPSGGVDSAQSVAL